MFLSTLHIGKKQGIPAQQVGSEKVKYIMNNKIQTFGWHMASVHKSKKSFRDSLATASVIKWYSVRSRMLLKFALQKIQVLGFIGYTNKKDHLINTSDPIMLI